MQFPTALTQKQIPAVAAEELAHKLGPLNSGQLVIFFVSNHYEPQAIAKALQKQFSEQEWIGCSSFGELAEGQLTDHSISAMALPKEATGPFMVAEADATDDDPVAEPFQQFEERFGSSQNWGPDQYTGLVLTAGVYGNDEKVIEKIGNRTQALFVGGAAADELQFQHTALYHNGKVLDNAALLILLKPELPFSVYKTQSFDVTDHVLTPTEVADAGLKVKKFDGQPATQAYAQALEVSQETLDEAIFLSPLGLVLDPSDPFVRSGRVVDEESIGYQCRVVEGMEMNLLQARDIVADTRQSLQQKQEALGGISGLVNFHCALRTLELQKKGQMEAYGQLFEGLPAVGYGTFGEHYLGMVNHSSTMLIFGQPQ